MGGGRPDDTVRKDSTKFSLRQFVRLITTTKPKYFLLIIGILIDYPLLLKVNYFDAIKAGEISSRLVNDTSQVKQLLANAFPQTRVDTPLVSV